MQLKPKHFLILGAILLFLFLSNVFLVMKVMKQSQGFSNYENAISALSDSVHVITKDGKSTFYQKAPEIDLDKLINSEYFKSLSENQQSFYKELKNIKGLMSATQAELEKHGQLLDQLQLTNLGTKEGDSLKFKYGQILSFKEKDTTKKLQWKAGVTLNDPIDFKLDYDYKFNIRSDFKRQKDKSVIVEYTVDDPDLKVNKIQSLTIPKEEKRTRLGRWIDHNKKEIIIVSGSVIFLTGAYAGHAFTK